MDRNSSSGLAEFRPEAVAQRQADAARTRVANLAATMVAGGTPREAVIAALEHVALKLKCRS